METIVEHEKTDHNCLYYALFMLFDYLLDSSSVNIVVFFLIHLVESLQLQFFFFNPLFSDYWSNKALFVACSEVLEYFWIDKRYIELQDLQAYSVFLYIFFAINVLTVISVIYMLICLFKQFLNTRIVKLYLVLIANIYLPILFIPMLHTFISVFYCSNDSSRVNVFNTIECWSGRHIKYFVIGVLGLIMVLLYGYILNTLFYDTNPKSRNIKARLKTTYERSMYITKIIWVTFFIFSAYFNHTRVWLCNLINLICSVLNFTYLIKDKPFFNTSAQRLLLIFRTLEFISSILLTLNLILTRKIYNGDWIIFLVSALLSIAIHYAFPENKIKIVISNIDSLRNEYLIQKKLIYMLDFAEDQDSSEREILFKGLVAADSLDPGIEILKEKVMSIARTPNEKKAKSEEEYAALIKYVHECYRKGVRKFPTSNSLRLSYLFFSIKYLGNPQTSIMIMKQIDQASLNFEEEFILFRYRLVIQERLLVDNLRELKLDINAEIKLEKTKRKFLKIMNITTALICEFWDHISRDKNEMSKIDNLIYSINRHLENISSVWKDIQVFNIIDRTLYIIYEQFLKKILNDDQGCNLPENMYHFNQSSLDQDMLLGQYARYIYDGSGYCLSSGKPESLGMIISLNSTFAKLFNYSIEEAKAMNIESLMPELYRVEHMNRLRLLMTDEKKEKSVFKGLSRSLGMGLKKSGYIFPLNLTMTVIHDINDDMQFLTLIRNPPSESIKAYPVYFLTDLNFRIRNVSAQAIPVFGINSSNIFIKHEKENEYLDMTLLIREVDTLRENPEMIKLGYSHKKLILIEDIARLATNLQTATEKNKDVKICNIDVHPKVRPASEENTFISLSHPSVGKLHTEIRYQDFFLTINEIKFGESTLGYLFKLEIAKEESDTFVLHKNILCYDNNLMHFSPIYGEFYDPSKQGEEKRPNESGIIEETSRRKRHLKHRKPRLRENDINTKLNPITNFIREKKIQNFAELQNVQLFIYTPNKHFKEIFKMMKVEETLRTINDAFKLSQVKQIDIFEDEQSDVESLLEKSSQELLNFKGIEGWELIKNRINQQKTPHEVVFIRYSSILVTIGKVILMIVFHLLNTAQLNTLITINQVQNLTMLHSNLIIDSVHKSEMLNYYWDIPSFKDEFSDVQKSLLENLNLIINITSSLRMINNIQLDDYGFYSNRTFILVNDTGVNPSVEMNMFEIAIQMINKLFSFSQDDYTYQQFYSDYFTFFLNACNAYLDGILTITQRLHKFINVTILNIEYNLSIIALFALIFWGICFLNWAYMIKITWLKQKVVNLFFTIPPKVCWKYYSNCEKFQREFLDEEEDHKKNFSCKRDTSQNVYNEKIHESLTTNTRRHRTTGIGVMRVVQLLFLNVLFFFIAYAYYGLNYVNFLSKKQVFEDIENGNHGGFQMNTLLNVYSINQRQMLQDSHMKILYFQNNSQLQDELYVNISRLMDMIKHNWTTTVRNYYSETQYLYDYPISSIISSGFCNQTNSSKFEKICQTIPSGYLGLEKIMMYVFENMTQQYVQYLNQPAFNKDLFSDAKYKAINDELIYYVNPLHHIFNDFFIFTLDYHIDMLEFFSLTLFIICTGLLTLFSLVYWMYQNRMRVNIIYSQATLLLIHPIDIKDIKPIMHFMKKEVYQLTTPN